MDTFQHIVPSIQTPHLTLEYLPFRLTNNKLHHPKYHTPQHRTSSPTPHPASLEPHSAPRVQEAPFALTILNRSPARKRHHAKLIGLASGEQTQRERSSKSTEPLSSANLHLRRPQTPLPSPCSDGAFACARGGFLEWLREPVELMRVGERCGERKRSRPGNMDRAGVGLTRVVGRHYLFVIIINDLCVLVCLCEVCHGVWAYGGAPWLGWCLCR